MNYLNSKTFCASAWFSIRNDNVEQLTPCCAIDINLTEFTGMATYDLDMGYENWHNSEYMQYLRQKLDSGIMPKECHRCHKAEQNNLQSIRLSSNKTIANYQSNDLKESWMGAYFYDKNNFESETIVSVDSMISNFCNYECVMCNPLDSSKIKSSWNKDKDIPIINNLIESDKRYSESTSLTKNKNAISHYQEILNKYPISFLHLRGGEPFIDNELLKLINSLSVKRKNNIRILFNTNCSVDLTEKIKQLNDFKDVIIVASLDAVGEHSEYIRKHSNWHTIEKNITKALLETDALFRVHCTVHALNYFNLNELENWCSQYNIPMTYEFVTYPDFLSLASVPHNELVTASKNVTNEGLSNRILQESNYDSVLNAKLKEYITYLDSKNKTSLNEILVKKGTEVPSFIKAI